MLPFPNSVVARRALAAIVVALAVRLAAAEPAASAPASVDELVARLERHVGEARFGPALWGVKIVTLGSGRVIFERHADRLLSPASNSKLYAGALALDRLGGDYRIVTPISGAAAPDAAGTLAGDLVVSGRGDPSWKSRKRREDFAEIFAPIVAAVRRAGIRRIAGDVVADATFFRGPPHGAGWTADDLNDDYGAEISALALEDNFADLRVTPAAGIGQPAQLQLLQPHTGLTIENRTTTVAKTAAKHLEARRLPGERVVYVFGEVPLGAAEEIVDVTVPRPAAWFAAALKEALVRDGIAVGGKARSVCWPEPSPLAPGAVKLGEVVSPPLREVIAALMKPSQNLETDLIFAHVGETLRAADTPAWRTSEQLGVQALHDFLANNGLPADEVRFEEGSGLSRNNLTTANATVALLRFMAAHREAAAFADALPIAGVDGTLRRRMKDTPAEGNVRAKTGTLRWASSLSGYVTTAAGERLVFSTMLNRAVLPPGRNSRDELDAIAVWLAQLPVRTAPAAAANSGAR